MDPITLLLAAGVAYGLIKSCAREDSGGEIDFEPTEGWKMVSTGRMDLLIGRESASGDHFSYNRKTNELHATFDSRKKHVPIEKGLGGLVEWDTLLNRDSGETKRNKLSYYKSLGINFNPGERFTYEHPWHNEEAHTGFSLGSSTPVTMLKIWDEQREEIKRERERVERMLESLRRMSTRPAESKTFGLDLSAYIVSPPDSSSLPRRAEPKTLFGLSPDSHSTPDLFKKSPPRLSASCYPTSGHASPPAMPHFELDLSGLIPEMFDNVPKSAGNAWANFSGTGAVVQTNPWNSFNQPVVENEWQRILENLGKYKLPEPPSHDPYLAAQEIAGYWDAKVGCGYFRPGETKDMSDYCVEDRIMKEHMRENVGSLMTRAELLSIFSGTGSGIETYSPSSFSLPKSSAWF